MLTREQARVLVDAHIARHAEPGMKLVVRDPPVDRPYGWVFSWARHATTPDSCLVDLPRLLVVEPATGRLIAIESLDPPRAWREFERSRGHDDLNQQQIDALCAVTDDELDSLFR